jgi:hypothetical protein
MCELEEWKEGDGRWEKRKSSVSEGERETERMTEKEKRTSEQEPACMYRCCVCLDCSGTSGVGGA